MEMPGSSPDDVALYPEGQDDLRLIDEITQGINRGNSVEEVFGLIYERLRPFVPYNRIAVAVTDEKRERLSIVAARSDGMQVLRKGYSGDIAGSSLEPLMREGRTRVINDLQDYLAKKPSSDSTRLIVKEGMRSSLTLPLLVGGEPVGVMFFSSRAPNAYRAEHERFLRGIVGHMAIALERSRLIETLRERGEYLENILHNSADAILAVDAQDRIRTWNEGARRIFGYAPGEALGKEYSILLPPEELRAGDGGRLRAGLEREGYLKDYECVRLTREGRRVPVSITSTLLRDKAGRVLGRSCILRDLTHLKKLQEEVVRTQSLAAVGELAATIAHEVKNPLAGISGAIQVLADAIPASDPRRGVVGEILEQISRLDNTVRDLLAFARPAVPARQDLDAAEGLARAWSILSQQSTAVPIRFLLEGAGRVQGDPHLLDQVWINLLSNAVEAMPQGGDLAVRVTGGASVRVEIQDTGMGIERANLAKIFKPFFSTKTRGTGLGLAITKKIVEAHGGKITVESEPRRGTRVVVEIPR